jgi:hypothetical protein
MRRYVSILKENIINIVILNNDLCYHRLIIQFKALNNIQYEIYYLLLVHKKKE